MNLYIYIFGISYIWQTYVYLYMTISLLIFISDPKNGQKRYLYQTNSCIYRPICISYLSLGITWADFYQTKPLQIGVFDYKKPKKEFLKNKWTKVVRPSNSYILGISVACETFK